jgi:hypothetical protein
MKKYGKNKTTKQKGGFNTVPLKNSIFKYTKDEKRIQWNKHTYPIGEYMIALVQSIPWLDYSFTGKVNFLHYDDEDEKYAHPLWIEKEIETKKITIPPYYYFGGCVYEILNSLYKKQLGNSLHTFTDPTGDIDVRLCVPNITIKEPDVFDYMDVLIEPDGKNNNGKNKYKINAFIDHYTKWIFENVENYLTKKMPKQLFDKIFIDTEEFDYKTNYEANFADLTSKIANLWLVRTIVNNMVKIQLTAKYKGMEESDHILEFVLPVEMDIANVKDFYRVDSLNRCKDNYYIILKDNIPIESLAELYAANIRAGKERIGVLDEDMHHHKFYNHIQRTLFLNNSLGKILNKPGENDEDKITLTRNEFIMLSTKIYNYCYWIINSRDIICKFVYENNPKLKRCDNAKVINKLVGGIEDILYKQEKNAKGNRIPYIYNPTTFEYKCRITSDEVLQIALGRKEGGKSPIKNRRTIKSKNRFKHK